MRVSAQFPVSVDGMYGLGDNIYQRAVVREIKNIVYLATPWPELYRDLPNIRTVKPNTNLRTQQKNVSRTACEWHLSPREANRMPRLHYVGHTGSMLSGLEKAAGVSARIFDLPDFGKRVGRPYIVVRPATLRAEWRADGRNPNPEYIAAAASMALDAGYDVISVADLQDGVEWLVGDAPPCTLAYHAGELSVIELMQLISGASGVIGGVGWIVPACVAYRTPLLLIFGGWGGCNGPARIFGGIIDHSLVTQALPDNFCVCIDPKHPCDKVITNFEGIGHEWIVRLSGSR